MSGRIPGIRRLFRVLGTRASMERAVDDELRFHIESRIEALMARGMSREAAREAAEREFGDVRAARAELVELDRRRARRSRLHEWAEAIALDLRYALRGLRTQPGLTIGIVLTLALGIGANATMFGVVDRLLLRPPAHVSDPGRLARVYITRSRPAGSRTTPVETYPTYVSMRDGVRAFQYVAAFSRSMTMSSGRGSDAMQVQATLVTANFFRVLGARPALGRFFIEEEAQPPDGAPVVVLGYGLWRRRFAGDPSVIGRTIPLGKGRYTIIGVAPEGLTTTELAPVDVWLPVSAAGPEGITWSWNEDVNPWLQMVARLRPGVDVRQAAAEALTVYRRIDAERARTSPFFRRTGPAPTFHVALEPVSGARNSDGALTAEARISRWLIGVSVIVLLIACANVTNLLLARATRRRRQIAVRLALGISRRRLVAQLIAEGVLLAALGGLVGLGMAQWGGALVRGVLLPGVLWTGSPVDMRVLGVTTAVVLVTGVLIGLAPAAQATATNLTAALKAGAREGVRRTRMRSALIVMQAALSVVLLVGAGLFVRSLWNVRAEDLGIDMEHVLLATVDLESVGYKAADRTAFLERAMQRLSALPGVEAAVMAEAYPFAPSVPAMSVRVPGRQDSIPGAHTGLPTYNVVSPGFFAALGMHIVRGRGFADVPGSGSRNVAVINETMAHAVWPGKDPLGQCIRLSDLDACTTIIGVVKDARRWRIREEPEMQFYIPFGHGWGPATAVLVRTRGDPALLVGTVRRTLQSLAPNLPYADVQPMQDLLNPQLRPWKLGATMFGIFGLLALVVASVGLYSVLAYDVAQRVHEMGVRMALGARTPDVVRLVLGDGLRVAVVGIVIGLGATLAAGRAVASLLFDTSPHDPTVLLVVCATLIVVAVLASLVPAWRATRVDPSTALRAE